jgi:ABC transporter transmembrane region
MRNENKNKKHLATVNPLHLLTTLFKSNLKKIPITLYMNSTNLLKTLFQRYRARILLTYTLLIVEEILELLYPFVIGVAINGLPLSNHRGVIFFACQVVVHLVVGVSRRMIDTRTYTRMYATLASNTALEQNQNGVELSQIAARSGMLQGFVDFFERDVSAMIRSIFAVLGAIVMLSFYDLWLVLFCVVLVVPILIVNSFYGVKSELLSKGLNDELEQQLTALSSQDNKLVHQHYSLLATWRIKLSDAEARNFGITQLFVLGLFVASLLRLSALNLEPGSIFSVFSYVLGFTAGLDNIPVLVQQLSRLRDIGKRLQFSTKA